MSTIVSKPPPKGYPRMSASIVSRNAQAEIDFLHEAFGFEIQLKVDVEGGKIAYSELVFGDALVSTGDAHKEGRDWQKPPNEVGGVNTQTLCFYVDDVDAHCERARAAGAVIIQEPKTTDYGEGYWVDRSYEAKDPEGHHWWFMQRLDKAK